MNNLLPESPAPPPPIQIPLPELISSLEQATLMAKQLRATADLHHLHQIYSSLHQANQNLSYFISQTQLSSFPPPPPHPPLYGGDNSLFSATGPEQDGDEPMDVGEEEAGNSIEKVEEKFRGCFIKNKRVKKRPLSPARLIEEDEFDSGTVSFYDPHEARIRALDLIYQFHG